MDVDHHRENIRTAATTIAALAPDYRLVITHGNGPQVGLLALQADAYHDVDPYPLDVLGAESEGMIGYLLEQALRRELPGTETATLLTQTVVDGEDAAFGRPTKPIGPVYGAEEASVVARERGWAIAPDGEAFRRVVASPEPRSIVEANTIRLLLDAGVVVICTGGGGIPVVEDEGGLRGVEAVVDKDLASALLAEQLDADLLLLLTDVPAVVAGWGTKAATPIGKTTPTALRSQTFATGSMQPKVEAASRFVERTGRRAAIGALTAVAELARGDAGTQILASASPTPAGRVLVAYASKHGSTEEVARTVAAGLTRRCGDRVDVEVRPASEATDVHDYDAVVLGGALYTGRLHRDARRFLKAHHDVLAAKPFAVFAMGPRTLAETDVDQSRAQLDHALADMPDIQPVLVSIFGGAVDPSKLHFPFNRMPASDARDWDAVDAFADEVARLVR
jgi:carbamate kinase